MTKTIDSDARQAIGLTGDQTIAIQAVFFRQPVAPLLRLAQAAGEKRNINGFCFIKCPDARADLGGW
ncbi:Uncharacterised protein [Salmonella enterica subsp. enterica serovar Typhimurium str. DT104]|nr:Uncharacterised protein [Salmonella enterica subsp. enterica serovar Typhimurium str. DT104]